MKKVLILTYYWPPSGGAGVQRWLKFVKYFDHYNWEPIVLTIKDGSYPSEDKLLEKEIPKHVKVFKVKCLEPFKFFNLLRGKGGKSVSAGLTNFSKPSFFQKIILYIRANYFIPDARKNWIKPAYKKALDLIEKENIDVLVTTGPPHSTHLAGLKIKEKINVNWVADMRDPWTGVFYNKFLPRTKSTIKKDKILEKKVLQQADLVTVVSDGLKKEFLYKAKKIEVVYNGFDSSDFFPLKNTYVSDDFTLSYVGNLKPSQNLSCLWKVLKNLKNTNSNFKDNFKLNLIGSIDSGIIEEIKRMGLINNLNINGYVTHKKATEYMQKTDMLLFIIPKVEDNELIITGKIFEYIASETPILSVGPIGGDASNILLKAKRNNMLDYNDEVGMLYQIKYAFEEWFKTKKQTKHKGDEVLQFSRSLLTQKMTNLFESL